MIHINSNKKERVENATVHLMPCTIKGSGEANVSKYFDPIIVHNEDKSKYTPRGTLPRPRFRI